MCFSNSYKLIRSWCITIKCLFEESQSNQAHVLIKLETMFGSDKPEDKPELGAPTTRPPSPRTILPAPGGLLGPKAPAPRLPLR